MNNHLVELAPVCSKDLHLKEIEHRKKFFPKSAPVSYLRARAVPSNPFVQVLRRSNVVPLCGWLRPVFTVF